MTILGKSNSKNFAGYNLHTADTSLMGKLNNPSVSINLYFTGMTFTVAACRLCFQSKAYSYSPSFPPNQVIGRYSFSARSYKRLIEFTNASVARTIWRRVPKITNWTLAKWTNYSLIWTVARFALAIQTCSRFWGKLITEMDWRYLRCPTTKARQLKVGDGFMFDLT